MATWSQSHRTLAYEGVADAGHEDSDEANYSTKDEHAVKMYPRWCWTVTLGGEVGGKVQQHGPGQNGQHKAEV